MTKAYWISAYRSISDNDALAAYATLAGPSLTAAGGKFLTRNGFLGEAYLGVGRSFGRNSNNNEAYPRVGITIGKRF